MKKINLLFIVLSLVAVVNAQNKPATPQLGKDSLKEVIKAMTLEDKIYMVMGLGEDTWKNPATGPKTVLLAGAAGRTWDIPRLGITPAVLTDGPAGLRIEPKQEGFSHPFYCTAFPTATVLASTWNTPLVEEVGKAMGNEVLEYGSDVLLAPALNIQRNPLCGRNFEYYSEDPLIAGKMAAAMVVGLQSNGVGTSVKHFAANNIETKRTTINAIVSQRALREIYLRGFEIAVKEGNPWTVMSSYNRLNGFYTSQNPDLLTTILRKEWGFKGMVMSDWWGGDDAVAQMKAGNDLLEPGATQREVLREALKNKTLSEKTLDRNLMRILDFIQKTPHFKGYQPSYHPDLEAHAVIARKAAVEGMVLLKNENSTLPFKKVKKIALFGKTSYQFMTGGTGSGEVNYDHAAALDEAFGTAKFQLSKTLTDRYRQFIDSVRQHEKKENQKFAVDFAPELNLTKDFIQSQVKNSDIAVITIGRQAGEGWDRPESTFSLSEVEKNLIKNVCTSFHAAKKKVVVVLNIGGVIETADWRDWPDAVLLAWQPGQQGAHAVVDLLKGTENPSGKLAVSFPMKYAEVPSAATFPGEPKDNPVNAFYTEGIYVGYRYYETFKVPTAYPFGYGLSYTSFKYSDLKLSNTLFDNEISVSVKITNIGKTAGKEVVQLYREAPKQAIDKPVKELKAFAKTQLLKPNESEVITFKLDARSLASFWSGVSAWIADEGKYKIHVGASSEDIRATGEFSLPKKIMVEKTHDVLYPNLLLHEISPEK